MEKQKYQRMMQVLGEAIERDPKDREAWLSNTCAGDEALYKEVLRLMSHEKTAVNFMEESPFDEVVRRQREERSLIGRQVGSYKIIEEIGRGGMGAVFLAQRADEQYESLVAVKVIKRGMDTDHILRSFRNERQILAYLNHPNIVRLFDGGTTVDGLPYFIMGYIKGQPIKEYCDEKKLSVDERLKLFRQVCSAVQYAHQNLIVHRDLKPSNILVTEDDVPKLLDFGIAKILSQDNSNQERTATMARAMTPEYASPEQVRGERVTTASDIYSLGVILYELLTGRRPYRFKGHTQAEVAQLISEQEPYKPSTAVSHIEEVKDADGVETNATPEAISTLRDASPVELSRRLRGDLDNIVLKAMRKEPARRYSSVEQFAEDIERHLEGLPVRARKDTFSYRASKFVQRNRVGVAAAALILLTLIGGIIATAWEAHVARVERAKAERRFDDVRALAHTFIFDLNDEIGKGPTQARALLVERALEYLGRLALEAGNDRALQLEMASAYLKVGDLQGAPYVENLGDVPGALASYRRAIAVLESLAASQPRDLKARRELSEAYQRIGELESRSGDWAASLESGRKSVELCEALLAADPSNAEYRALAVRAYTNLGDAQSLAADGDLSLAGRRAALESYRKALAVGQSLLDGDPSNNELLQHVMKSYERIGFAYMGMAWWLDGDVEDKRQALAHMKKALELRQALLASEPSNAHFRRSLADGWMEVGLAQSNLDEDDEAIKSYGRSWPTFEELAAADSTNMEAQRDLFNVYARVATSFAKLNDARRNQEYAHRALSIFERLHAADPKNIEDRFNAELVYDSVGDALRNTGDTAGALDSYRKAVAVNEDWLAVEPGSAKGLRALTNEYTKVGSIYVMIASKAKTSGDRSTRSWREARAWYQKSFDIWQELRGRGVLGSAGAGSLDEVEREIAKCNEALKKLGAD